MVTRHLLVILALIVLSSTVTHAQTGKPLYTISVTRGGAALGAIDIELFPDIAPKHAANFDSLVGIGFYDGTAFHRVVPGFVIQGGDPNSRSGPDSTWGFGAPGQQTVPAEFSRISHLRGILSAARAQDPNSATSQFFICVANATNLDGRYSVYGRVLSGLDVVDAIVNSPVVSGTQRPQEKVVMIVSRRRVDTTTPEAPMLTGPANDTVRVSTAQSVRWSPVADAILYEVQLSTSPLFGPLERRDSVVVTNALFSNLRQGLSDYYWRVRASNGGKRGPWSEVRHFTTAMSSPQLLSPPTGSVDLPSSVPCVWASVFGAISYRLELATSLSFTNVVLDTAGLIDTTLLLRGLSAGTRYYWRVTASDGSNDSPSSLRWNFSTAAVTSVEDRATSADADAVTITRETGSSLRIDLKLQYASVADVEFVDVRGVSVGCSRFDLRGAGRHTVRIDAADLESGSYLCVVRTGGRIVCRKIAIVR